MIIMVIHHPLIKYCLSEINSQHSMLDFHKDKSDSLQNKLQGNISKKQVSIFGKFTTGMSLMHTRKIYPTLNVSFTICYLRNVLFNKNTKTIDEIHVSIYAPILQLRYIIFERNNSQHSMLSIYDNKNISINNQYQKTFPEFVLAIWLFIILSLTLVYLQVIDNILCQL